MKTLFYFILFCLSSCNHLGNTINYIPIEYQYPLFKIGKGKLIFYEKTGSNRQDFTTKIKLIEEIGVKYLIISNYAYGSIIDSSKISIGGKLVEKYDFDLLHNINVKSLKAEIIEDKIINNENKYGKRISKLRYTFLNKKINITEEEKYLYDTIVNYNGLQLKCFVTETKSKIQYEDKGEKIAEEIVKKKSYFVKERGLFCYKIDKKGDSSIWFQMGIENNE